MIEYASETVIKLLKQYDMLLKSLKFTTDLKQKQEVCLQMTRIIQRVLDITRKVYEEKYLKVLNRSTFLMDEERNRLLELINLINERKTYVTNQIDNNYENTGISFNVDDVLGEDKLDEYKEQVKIIERYKNNIKLDGVLKDEIASLDVSIKKANDKIGSNRILNRQLESKMIRLLDKAFDKLSLYELKERDKEIDLAYTELGYSLEKAKENAKIARKDCSSDIILECDNMLASITLEYERYKEKKLILRLIDIYKNPVSNYDELLSKREEINSILNGIVSSDLYLEVGEELNKEYATIKLEAQDAATLKSLIEEKNNKVSTLERINRENSSAEFKGMLANLLENEKKHQEKLLLEKKKREEERKKEIEERTKQLLVEKKNPILSTAKNIKKDENDKHTNIKTKLKDNASELRVNTSKVNVKPKEDIFTNTSVNKVVDKGIPVVKNDNFRNSVVATKKVERHEDVFPKVKLDKKEDIFPDFPDMNNSFFDKEEFDDLNDDTFGESQSKWF